MMTILKRLSQALFEDTPQWIERMLVADEKLAALRRPEAAIEERGVIKPGGAGGPDRGSKVTSLNKEKLKRNKHQH